VEDDSISKSSAGGDAAAITASSRPASLLLTEVYMCVDNNFAGTIRVSAGICVSVVLCLSIGLSYH